MRNKLIFLGIPFFILFIANITLIATLFINDFYRLQTRQILNEIAAGGFIALPSSPLVLGASLDEAADNNPDGRAANLKSFFRKYNSPLYDYADVIIAASDKYGFDYRLLPAIAMQESNLCTKIPKESHNCWGWGIYGGKVTRFDSYEEAINTIAQGMKEHYLDKGMVTASQIMKVYNPSSSGSWAHGVNLFIKALE